MERPLFEAVDPAVHGIDFENRLREGEDFNIVEYLYYYNGGGVGLGDFDGDGRVDVFLTGNEVPDRLYRNLGDWRFEEVTAAAGIPTRTDQSWSTGVSVADVNGDGKPDIYVSRVDGYKGRAGCNLLYLNTSAEGRLQFREATAAFNLQHCGFGQQAAFFDYDLDGDLDVYLLSHSVHSPDNYGDSKLRERRDERAGDRLLRNDGDRFVDVSAEAGILGSKIGYGLGVRVADLSHDGYPDLYVTNDFAEQDYLYINQRNGTFREQIAESTVSTSQFSMGVDAADVNGDGKQDLMTLDMRPEEEVLRKRAVGPDAYNIYEFKRRFGYHYQYPRNHLQLYAPVDTGLRYREAAELAGLGSTDWSWSVLLQDLDLDGRTDVFVTNGIERRPNDLDYLKFTSTERMQARASNLALAAEMPTGRVANRAFRQDSTGGFVPAGERWGLAHVGSSHGAAVADFDNDGDPDLLVNNLNEGVSLYRNRAAERLPGGARKLLLRDSTKNTAGLGAAVSAPHFYAELQAVRGWQSSSEAAVYLPRSTGEVTVGWPGGGRETFELDDTRAVSVLRRGAGTSAPPLSKGRVPTRTARLPLAWQHAEDDYTDFDVEKLLPRKLSTAGPALLVADLTGDGSEEMIVGGARGQRSLYRGGDGRVRPFPDDTPVEVVDLRAFDADGDGDLDVYAVHADGRPGPPAPDRLYLNAGQGRFDDYREMPTAEQGSFVLPFDYDRDGDVDLFRGSRHVVGAYGIAPKSYLLENRGGGRFVDVSASVLPEQRIGMLTGGQWLPAEHTLYLVGEWMRPHRLDFSDPHTVSNTKFGHGGWWRTLAAVDVDSDGDTDLVGGNLGLNSDLTASPDAPLRLYLKDFDSNGTLDPLITRVRQGTERLLIGKDELVAQLPHKRKRFPRYAAFAGASFAEVFDREELRGTNLKIIEQLASVWWENTPDGWVEHPLPRAVQTGPVNAIATTRDGTLLTAGGDFGFVPAVGRLASPILILDYREGGWELRPAAASGALAGYAVHDIAALAEKKYLIATNNGPLFTVVPDTQ